MNVFEILNLRSQWEELAQTLNVEADSTISGLENFVENSHKNNRFKEHWEPAVGIAKEILSKYAC